MKHCKECVAQSIVLRIEQDIREKFPTTVGVELGNRAHNVLASMRKRWSSIIMHEMNKGNLL